MKGSFNINPEDFRVEGYKTIKLLGSGSGGVSFLSERLADGGHVVLKYIREEDGNISDMLPKLQGIISLTGKLSNQGIAAISKVFEASGNVVLERDYIDAVSLTDFIKKRRTGKKSTDVLLILTVIENLIEVLADMHDSGFSHMAIKPSNVLVKPDMSVVITDSWVAKIVTGKQLVTQNISDKSVFYMPPEQVLLKKTSHCVDVYSVGIMVYSMITGELPFQSSPETYLSAAKKISDGVDLDFDDTDIDIPSWLPRFFRKSVSTIPEHRFPDCVEMLKCIRSGNAGEDHMDDLLERNDEVATGDEGIISFAGESWSEDTTEDLSGENSSDKSSSRNSKIFWIFGLATAVIALLTFFNHCQNNRSNSNSPTVVVEDIITVHGGSGNDRLWSIVDSKDGGSIAAGYTNSYGSGEADGWLIKFDSSGDRVWSRYFGSSVIDEFYGVCSTSDGGYLAVGHTFQNGTEDLYVVKVSTNGNTLWTKIIGNSEADWGFDVMEESNGDFLIVGSTDSYGSGSADVWLCRISSQGNLLWHQVFGGSDGDWGYSLTKAGNGNSIIVGRSMSYSGGDADILMLKVNSQGELIWRKTFGGSDDEWGRDVIMASNGDFIIAGSTSSSGYGADDAWIIRTSSSGNIIWSETFGTSRTEVAYSIAETESGNLVFAGKKMSTDNENYNFWLSGISENGTSLWSKTWGGRYDDRAYSVFLRDGYATGCGYTEPSRTSSADGYLVITEILD